MELQKGPKSPLSSFLALLWLSLLRVEHCNLVCAVINHSCPEKKRSKEIFGPSQALTLGLQAEVTMRKHGWQLPNHPLQAFCAFLAMVATLPLAQLCFFHMLLVKKGISTYDYVIALREQEREQATGDQESPQMSRVSSMAGLSTTSPFIAFHRGAWCTPPRSFLEEQTRLHLE
ncbi:hypothetical protein C4D60_Mb04t10520 [Musa balbisiana]|uniref:Protein S-acyltransferase n=1 Tax=Musa balbisiana TaxID=52838 RepID=A0A4S8KB48_MUSBA|nr:hypothetical protein C4D60_Mb04t10520 [Musa balbisiana]